MEEFHKMEERVAQLKHLRYKIALVFSLHLVSVALRGPRTEEDLSLCHKYEDGIKQVQRCIEELRREIEALENVCDKSLLQTEIQEKLNYFSL